MVTIRKGCSCYFQMKRLLVDSYTCLRENFRVSATALSRGLPRILHELASQATPQRFENGLVLTFKPPESRNKNILTHSFL